MNKKAIFANWKTSLLGVGMILIAFGNFLRATFDGEPETVANMEMFIAEIMIGFGFIFTRDSDKSSEQSK